MNSQLVLRQQLLPWLWGLAGLVLGSSVWAFLTLNNLVQNQWIEAVAYFLPRASGALICFLVARGHSGRARLAWSWVASGFICYALASLVYQGLALSGFSPFPSVADVGYLIFPVFLMVGFFLFVEGSFHRRERLRLTLDALIIAMVVAIYIWFALLAPALAAHIARDSVGLDMVLSTIYLVQDLVVLGVLLVCLARWSRLNFQRMGWWLLGGWGLFTVADGYFLARCFIDGLPTKHPLETGWNWAALCFAVAAVQSLRPYQEVSHVKFDQMRLRLRQFGVYTALIVVLPLVVILPERAEDFGRVGVQVGIGLLVLLVIARQLVFSVHLEQANAELHLLSVSLEERVQLRTEALSFRASHDVLTGLANRVVFEQALLAALSDLSSTTAVIFMDLDRFKQINDTLGHALGDLALREVATRMQAVLPTSALLARHGGDEFMLLLPNLEPSSALMFTREIANVLLKSLQAPIGLESSEVYLDLSIGASFAPIFGGTVSVLEQQADVAMYFAKRSGLGYSEFSFEMRSNAVQRLEIEGRLRRDLEAAPEDSMWLVYQPIVQLSSRKIVAVEALLRHKAFSTGQIVPIAEESGLMLRLGAWILETACIQAAAWDKAGTPVHLSVNVSTVQFERPDFVELVLNVLAKTKLRPELLELELLESVLVTRFEDTALKMEQLRAVGVRFALDDFGTGYSSLAYLHRLPFDTIKVDRSFVHGLSAVQGRNSRPLIQAVLSIASAFGCETVVEGVETQAELTVLLELNASLTQGYFFAKPLTVLELEPLLRLGLV